MAPQTRWRQRHPNILASRTSRPPVLLVKKSRSCEVAWIRHRSFCESGCELAAQDAWESLGDAVLPIGIGLTDVRIFPE